MLLIRTKSFGSLFFSISKLQRVNGMTGSRQGFQNLKATHEVNAETTATEFLVIRRSISFNLLICLDRLGVK